MEKYSFYIYNKKWLKPIQDLTLSKAIENFKTEIHYNDSDYVALGINYNNSSCDLIVKQNWNLKLSNDYKSITELKNDKLITNNIIKVIKTRFY